MLFLKVIKDSLKIVVYCCCSLLDYSEGLLFKHPAFPAILFATGYGKSYKSNGFLE